MKKCQIIILLFILIQSNLLGQVSCVPQINARLGIDYFYSTIPPQQIHQDTICIFLPTDSTKGLYHKNYTGVYFDTTISGIFKIYLPKDSVLTQIVTIKNGQKNGILFDFFENGEIKLSAEYINDEETGNYISYYEFGKIKRDGKYVNNEFIGKTYEYWNNHNLASETIHDGITHWGTNKVNYWDMNGNVIDKITFDSLWYPCK